MLSESIKYATKEVTRYTKNYHFSTFKSATNGI